MRSATIRHEVSLAARGVFDIADAAGLEIACATGSVWVTLDGDPRDIVLERGESFACPERRRVLVYAFGDAVLEVRERVAKSQTSALFDPPGRTLAFA